MTRTTRTSDCPSKLSLERLLHDEVSVEVHSTLHSHVDSCDSCSAWLAAARAETKRLSLELDSAAFAAKVVERLDGGKRDSAAEVPRQGLLRQWLLPHRLAWAAVAVAGIVALSLTVTLVSRPPERTAIDTTRVKGSTFVRLYLKRTEQVSVLETEDRTQPGDAIRFEVFPGRYRHLMVLSVQPDGEATLYVPFGGERSRPVTPHRSLLLEGSIVLEGVADELLAIVLSDRPIAATRAKEAAHAALRRVDGQIDRVQRLDLPGETHLRLLRRKE